MKLTANQSCSASVQVWERFSEVFSRRMLALDICMILYNRLPPFAGKMGGNAGVEDTFQ